MDVLPVPVVKEISKSVHKRRRYEGFYFAAVGGNPSDAIFIFRPLSFWMKTSMCNKLVARF